MYWKRRRLFAREHVGGVETEVAISDVVLLAALNEWTSPRAVQPAVSQKSAPDVRRSIERLVAMGLVERSDRAGTPEQQAIASWESWSPEATFFHFGTKGGTHIPLEEATQQLEVKRRLTGAPDPLKQYVRGRRLELPPFDATGALPDVLLARRSWRRFGTQPIALRDLSTLLGLTWGVQRWMSPAHGTRAPLKTSPSGGACHSIEAYLLVQRVAGVERGVYHYCPDRHALTRIQSTRSPAIAPLLRQPWFARSAVAAVMTSVWGRVQWKYEFPRAYRTVLLEAGHFAQTFCLVATWLGLAPFCSGAFDDHAIESVLGIDGVREGVIYVTGVGARPRGTAWAPWPEVDRTPTLSQPSYRKRHTAAAGRRRS